MKTELTPQEVIVATIDNAVSDGSHSPESTMELLESLGIRGEFLTSWAKHMQGQLNEFGDSLEGRTDDFNEDKAAVALMHGFIVGYIAATIGQQVSDLLTSISEGDFEFLTRLSEFMPPEDEDGNPILN